jgi:hypothetical protein
MLSLIIPSLESIIGENINVYLEPLVEELKKLWKIGVHVWNAATFNGEAKFNMQAILLWTIHDLQTYGTIVKAYHKGILGMPHMFSTHNISSIESNVQECVFMPT